MLPCAVAFPNISFAASVKNRLPPAGSGMSTFGTGPIPVLLWKEALNVAAADDDAMNPSAVAYDGAAPAEAGVVSTGTTVVILTEGGVVSRPVFHIACAIPAPATCSSTARVNSVAPDSRTTALPD